MNKDIIYIFVVNVNVTILSLPLFIFHNNSIKYDLDIFKLQSNISQRYLQQCVIYLKIVIIKCILVTIPE